MKKRTIRKSIEISAPPEIVWDVLFEDNFTRQWYAEFSEGCYADTDWKLGSKAIFSDHSRSGLIGRIVVNEPFEVLTIMYTGFLQNGVEDYEGEIALDIKGGLESYRLLPDGNNTLLSIEADMGEEFFDSMSEAWDRALEKIKKLARQLLVVNVG